MAPAAAHCSVPAPVAAAVLGRARLSATLLISRSCGFKSWFPTNKLSGYYAIFLKNTFIYLCLWYYWRSHDHLWQLMPSTMWVAGINLGLFIWWVVSDFTGRASRLCVLFTILVYCPCFHLPGVCLFSTGF